MHHGIFRSCLLQPSYPAGRQDWKLETALCCLDVLLHIWHLKVDHHSLVENWIVMRSDITRGCPDGKVVCKSS